MAAEIVPRVLHELPKPVTIVSEPLIGSVGPLGVLSLAFVAQPEPASPTCVPLDAGGTHGAGPGAGPGVRARTGGAPRREAGRERLSLLSEVTRLLSSSLEPTIVIRRTMSLVEGRLADSGSVLVPGENGLVRLDVASQAGVTVSAAGAEARTRSSVRLRRTGRRRLPHGPHPTGPAPCRRGRADPRFATALAVPLTANGEVIGVMTFVDGPGRLFEADDVSLATEVASRAGVALSNATRFQREHVVADVLQRAVLPDSLPESRGSCSTPSTGRGGRDLRRRRLVRRVRAQRGLGLLQRGRRHGQGGAGSRLDGSGAKCDPRLRRLRAFRRPRCSRPGPALRHAHRGQGGHRRRRHHHSLERTGRPEQRRSPAAARGARRRQCDVLPHATDAPHRGRAERRATAPGRARARPG